MAFLWQLVLLKVVFPAQECTVVFLTVHVKASRVWRSCHTWCFDLHTYSVLLIPRCVSCRTLVFVALLHIFPFSSSLLSVFCSLVQLLRVFTTLCYSSGFSRALRAQTHPDPDCTVCFYDRLYVWCLHVCCWDVWRVLVGGRTGGEMKL